MSPNEMAWIEKAGLAAFAMAACFILWRALDRYMNRTLADNTTLTTANQELVKEVTKHVADSTAVLRDVSDGLVKHDDKNREAHEKLLKRLNEVCGNLKAANGKPAEQRRGRG